MSYTVQEFDTKEEWLKARREYITSSDVPALLGVSPYDGHNAFTIWEAKVHGREQAFEGMERRFQIGLRSEETMAEWFMEDTGLPAFRPSEAPYYLLVHDDGILAATPDYEVVTPDVEGLLELKTASMGKAAEYREAGDPMFYAVSQLHQGFAVTGRKHGWVGVMGGMGLSFDVYPIEHSEALVGSIRARAHDFMRLVREGRTPGESFLSPDKEVVRALGRILGEENEGEEIDLPDLTRALFDRYEEIRAEKGQYNKTIKALEKEEAEIAGKIALLMGKAEIGRVPGRDRVFTFKTRRGGGYYVDPWESRTVSTKKG